jgi:hypothetical protein
VFADEPACRSAAVTGGNWRSMHRLTYWYSMAAAKAKVTSPLDPAGWLRPGGVVVLDDFTPEAGWPPHLGGILDEARLYWLEHPRLRTAEIRVTPTAASLVATYIG